MTEVSGFSFEAVSVIVSDGSTILDGVDATIPRAGLTVVAGPSGSGKSTLLRLCNRLEVPTSGRVRLDGVDLATTDVLALRRRAGMVFQRPVLFAGTVRENLLVARADVDDGRRGRELARVGLDPALLDRQADDLSGGEAQRMCIARTLLTDPEILLLDEATSALDVDARAVIELLAKQFVADGLMVVWVTHDLEQAERLADRTLVVLGGRVVPELEAQRYLVARSFAAAPDRADESADDDPMQDGAS